MLAIAATSRLHNKPWLFIAPSVAALAVTLLILVAQREPGVYRSVLGLTYLAVLGIIAVHDVRTLKAPNRIVYPALVFAGLASLTLGMEDAAEALLGGVLAFVVLLGIALAGRGAMGFGDVKVGCLCGMVVGLHGVLPMLLITFVLGGAFALFMLGLRLRRRKDVVAFTPLLVAGTACSMAFYPLYLWW